MVHGGLGISQTPGGIQGLHPRGGQGKPTGIVQPQVYSTLTLPWPKYPRWAPSSSCPRSTKVGWCHQGDCALCPALCPAVATQNPASPLPRWLPRQESGSFTATQVMSALASMSSRTRTRSPTLQVLQVCALQWGDHFMQAVTRIQRRGAGHGGDGWMATHGLPAPVCTLDCPSPAGPRRDRCWRQRRLQRHCCRWAASGWAGPALGQRGRGGAAVGCSVCRSRVCVVALSMAVVSPLTGSRSIGAAELAQRQPRPTGWRWWWPRPRFSAAPAGR